VSPKREQLVLRLGAELHSALVDGRDPRTVPLERAEVLTLHAGLQRYLEPGAGAFVADTEHRRRLVRCGRVLEDVLGVSMPWPALGLNAAERVWRTLARRAEGGRGLRKAEQVVGLLFAAADWLRQCRLIDRDAGPTASRAWRRRLKHEWSQVAGVDLREPERPRYSVDEARALLRAATDPRVDARIRLALLLGPELRLGALITRVRRSMLDLRLGTGVGYGTVRIPGSATKRGVSVALDAAARAELDAALSTGHLRELEAEYRAQGIDYPLFPGGRARGGRFLAIEAVAPMSLTTLRTRFRELEDLAGIPHVPGRLWYGLRRIAADEAARLGARAGERVLDELGGWTPTSVRGSRYLEREAAHVRHEADVLRLKVRHALRTPSADGPRRHLRRIRPDVDAS